MKIIKRNGSEVSFDLSKIENAIKAANHEVPEDERLTEREIKFASLNVEDKCKAAGHTVTVEEIQDMVEDQLMALDRFSVARKYIIYRYEQNKKRHKNTTDDKILSLIECVNEEVKQENSNKNPTACCLPTSSTPTRRASSTSTTPTTSHSTCTTATSSTSRTCCKTALSSPAR